MLHIANGDAFAARLREGQVGREIVSWDDMMSEGPLPNGLRDEADWRFRAQTLAQDYPGLDPDAYVRAAAERLTRVGKAAAHEEVVLWFDEELFCQANLCHLLDWLARETPDATLSLVLDPATTAVGGLRELLAERETVSRPRMVLARAFWNALSSADPTGVPRLLRADLSAWPSLAVGLRAHLARFPDARGLDGVEEELLKILARGPVGFPELFAAWHETPLARACGFGDAQIAIALRRLAPLASIDRPREDFMRWRLAATPEGQRVLAGETAAPARERWIGGCRLEPGVHGWRRVGPDALARA
jgi:hypothetical protein